MLFGSIPPLAIDSWAVSFSITSWTFSSPPDVRGVFR